LPPLIAQVEFDRADIPRIMGLVTAVNQTVLAFAPGVIGSLHDATGGYVIPFALAAAIQSLAAIVILLGRSMEKRG
jgi:cyanate permease